MQRPAVSLLFCSLLELLSWPLCEGIMFGCYSFTSLSLHHLLPESGDLRFLPCGNPWPSSPSSAASFSVGSPKNTHTVHTADGTTQAPSSSLQTYPNPLTNEGATTPWFHGKKKLFKMQTQYHCLVPGQCFQQGKVVTQDTWFGGG